MSPEGLLYRVDAPVIALALFVAMLAAAWAGYRLALRSAKETALEALTELGPVEGAVGGLLALVLAFSFTMAAERFGQRENLIVRQSDAIENAFLRCSVLERDDRAYCEDQLRTYVDLFVAYGAATSGDEKIAATLGQVETIERTLWGRVAGIARNQPTPVNATLLAALNEIFDRRGDRVASMRIVVPQEVTVVLLALCIVWGGIAGYAYGLKRNEKRVAWFVFSALVAVVVYVTLDFDRPRRGFLRLDAGNQSMIDLQESLRHRGPPSSVGVRSTP